MTMFRRILEKKIVVFFVLLLASFAIYHGIFSTFYQQDEWQSLGHNIAMGWSSLIPYLSPLNIVLADGRVLARAFYLVFLSDVQWGVAPIFVLGLLAHAGNAYLVFFLVKKLQGNLLACWVAALFFVGNSVADQSVLWASAVITVFATTMVLVSLLFYIDFLQTGNNRKKLWAFVIGVGSLYMKETGLIIFVLFPLLFAWWHRTKNLTKIVRIHAPLLLYGVCMIGIRLMTLVWGPHYAGFVDGKNGGFLLPFVYHSLAHPLISFSQIFIPAADMYGFVPMIARSEYPYLIDSPLINLVAQSAVADVLSLVGTCMFAGLLTMMIALEKKKKHVRNLIFVALGVFALSFLPYAVLHKSFSYMSARYYYLGVVGGALVFGYVISWVMSRVSTTIGVVVSLALIAYGVHQTQAIWTNIALQQRQARERIAFLQTIQHLSPPSGDKTVFYITSDKKYVGETTYPFQNGLGYILEVLYYKTGKIPKEFLVTDFLWDLGSEGYKEQGRSGFGYFEHRERLENAVKEGKVDPSIVRGYLYNSATDTMTDISPTLREQLATLSGTLE